MKIASVEAAYICWPLVKHLITFSIKIRILTIKCLHVILFLLNPSTTSTTKNIKLFNIFVFSAFKRREKRAFVNWP